MIPKDNIMPDADEDGEFPKDHVVSGVNADGEFICVYSIESKEIMPQVLIVDDSGLKYPPSTKNDSAPSTSSEPFTVIDFLLIGLVGAFFIAWQVLKFIGVCVMVVVAAALVAILIGSLTGYWRM